MSLKLLFVNILTFIRIIGTIILIPIYKTKGGLWAGIFSFICYATDVLDGFLARHFRVSTFFGALFDGIADKLFTIVNFIVLYLITPYAIIPIIFEVLTVILNLIKFNKNCNVGTNIIGKIKIWILAISLITAFLISSVNDITLIPLEIRNNILSINQDKLYFYTLLPAIIICVLSFTSYAIEMFKPNKKVSEVTHSKKDVPYMDNNKGFNYFKNIWLNPEFYYNHKNDTNLKNLRKLTKE